MMESNEYRNLYDNGDDVYNDYIVNDPQQQYHTLATNEGQQDITTTNAAFNGNVNIMTDSNNNADFDDPKVYNLPRILLMGPRRGGKTSIQRVVFGKMSPHETLFRLEATQDLERFAVDHTPLCKFTVWDFPGDYYGESDVQQEEGQEGINQQQQNEYDIEPEQQQQQQQQQPESQKQSNIFAGATSLIFVVDAQDEPYDHVLQSFTNAVTRALEQNSNIVIEVFINKVDGELFLSDESKYDCRRDIMTQVTDELTDAGVSPDSIHIRYHLTSIYDHSIYEALSRVVQRLIPQLPTLENLLNVLVSTCSMEKAYLFDVVTKLYICTDPGPVDMQSVELCSDMIDVVLDVSGIYGLGPSQLELGNTSGEITSSIANGNNPDNDSDRNQQRNNKDGVEPSSTRSTTDELVGTLISQAPAQELEEGMIDPDTAYDSESASVIRLSNGMVLYLKEVDQMLALVCITRAENFRKKSLINYNINCLKKALRALAQPASRSTSVENGH